MTNEIARERLVSELEMVANAAGDAMEEAQRLLDLAHAALTHVRAGQPIGTMKGPGSAADAANAMRRLSERCARAELLANVAYDGEDENPAAVGA